MDDFIFPLEIRIYFDTQLQFAQLTTDIKQDGFEPNLYIPLLDEDNEPLDEDTLYIANEEKGICLLFRDEASCLDHLSDTAMLGKNLFFSNNIFL